MDENYNTERTEDTVYENESENDQESEVQTENIENNDLYNNNDKHIIDHNENFNDYKDDFFFYTYTGLEPKEFKAFVININKFSNKHSEIKWFMMEKMCSIYAYLKLFMDSVLRNVYKRVIIDLLSPFTTIKKGSFIKQLRNIFIEMTDDELINKMQISEEIVSKSNEKKDIIEKLEKASNDLDSINKKATRKPSRIF